MYTRQVRPALAYNPLRMCPLRRASGVFLLSYVYDFE